jgi:cleavage and polyadenylation specificity factor subunit 2
MLDSKVPLAGVELEIFQQEQQVMREKAEVARATLARNQQLLEADEGADSSESDSYAADEKDVELALGLDADATRTLGS